MGQPEARIRVCGSVMKTMFEEARRHRPLECCGLLAGREGLISHIYPATNALRSPVAFEVPPEELFRFFREMRQQSLQHMGIYHSHPSGDPHPSPRDIERAYYSDVAYFVVVTAPKGPAGCGAFYIRDGQVQEVDIEIVDSE